MPYQHYQVRFPDENMQIRVSGNYSIRIFLKDRKKPLIERRFCVYETGSQIALKFEKDLSASLMTHQQLSARATLKPALNLSQNS